MIRFVKRAHEVWAKREVIDIMDDATLLASLYPASVGEDHHVRLISKHVMIFELDEEIGPAALNVKFQRRS